MSRCYVSAADHEKHFHRDTVTHYVIPYGTVYMGRYERAFCGKLVEDHQISPEPTCRRCAELADEYERAEV